MPNAFGSALLLGELRESCICFLKKSIEELSKSSNPINEQVHRNCPIVQHIHGQAPWGESTSKTLLLCVYVIPVVSALLIKELCQHDIVYVFVVEIVAQNPRAFH